MNLRRNILAVGGLFGAILVVWALLWIQLFACFPPEQVYFTSISSDGSKTARFSVKYEGLYRWLPCDIEPRYYITVAENIHGRMLLRQSAFHGDLRSSFSELGKQYAPWAVTDLASPPK